MANLTHYAPPSTADPEGVCDTDRADVLLHHLPRGRPSALAAGPVLPAILDMYLSSRRLDQRRHPDLMIHLARLDAPAVPVACHSSLLAAGGTPSPAWGNWVFCSWSRTDPPVWGGPAGRVGNSSEYGPAHFHPILAGGGLQRAVARRIEIIKLHNEGAGAAALYPWGKWYGRDAHQINQKFIENSIGGPIADSTRENYKGRFEQRATFRRINGLGPYLSTDPWV